MLFFTPGELKCLTYKLSFPCSNSSEIQPSLYLAGSTSGELQGPTKPASSQLENRNGWSKMRSQAQAAWDGTSGQAPTALSPRNPECLLCTWSIQHCYESWLEPASSGSPGQLVSDLFCAPKYVKCYLTLQEGGPCGLWARPSSWTSPWFSMSGTESGVDHPPSMLSKWAD